MNMEHPDSQRRRLGVALSGGATRGLAHIGVLQALEANGLVPDFLSGTSIGAFAAALYAFRVPLSDMYTVGHGMAPLRISRLKLTRFGLFSNEEIGRLIEEQIGRARIEDAPIPLAIVATDIGTGEKVVLREGIVATAVMASSAMAGIYQPVRLDGRMLMDGGIMEDVPVTPLRPMGADTVVAVNLSAERKYRTPEDIIDILFNAFDIAIDQNTKEQVKDADVVIEPNLAHFRRMDVKLIDEMVAEGHRAAMERIPDIRKALERPPGVDRREDRCR